MQRLTRPLFRIGAGWLYLAAGLVLCAAGVLLPAAAEWEDLRGQRERLQAEQARSAERLATYSEFVDALDRDDPALVRRLAAAHLKLVPAGEIPLLIAASASQTEREWIDASLSPIRVPERRSSTSVLASLASGRARLWLLGGGFFAIFLGLVLDPFRDAVAADAGSVGAERDDPLAGGAMGCPGQSEPGSRRIAA